MQTQVLPSCLRPCHCGASAPIQHRHAPHRVFTDIRVQAASGQEVGTTFQGKFGQWTLTQQDLAEVWGYRAGLSVTAGAMLLGSSVAFLPDGAVRDTLVAGLDPICLGGALGLGASLQLIHIYLAVLKRALQALWLLGTCGGVYLMLTQDVPAAQFVAEQPWATWLVGPLFAALTGVAFKEWFCYGKQEAVGAFFTIPALMLTHLFASSWVAPDTQRYMLAAMVALVTVFAVRKYSQAVKDDIGDKSVFDFLALPPEQQKARMAGMAADEE